MQSLPVAPLDLFALFSEAAIVAFYSSVHILGPARFNSMLVQVHRPCFSSGTLDSLTSLSQQTLGQSLVSLQSQWVHCDGICRRYIVPMVLRLLYDVAAVLLAKTSPVLGGERRDEEGIGCLGNLV